MDDKLSTYLKNHVIGLDYAKIHHKKMMNIFWDNLSMENRILAIQQYINDELQDNPNKQIKLASQDEVIFFEVIKKCESIIKRYEKVDNEKFIYRKKTKDNSMESGSLATGTGFSFGHDYPSNTFAFIMENSDIKFICLNEAINTIEETKEQIAGYKDRFSDIIFSEYISKFN